MSNRNIIRLQASYASPVGVTDGGVIRGCSITTVGEALGHGVHLDESFILEAYQQAESLRLGLKARFGHPSMCNEALGTTVGRFKNFAISRDGKRLLGDLHFGDYANEDYKKHIIGLAKEDPEAFGTSIVFKVGGYYRKDKDGAEVDVELSDSGTERYIGFDGDPEDLSEELYVVCGEMLGCDFVDEPAANPGGLFASATPAHEVKYFLSENPEIKKLLQSNKNVVDIIEKYGVHIKQYLGKEPIMQEENTHDEEALDSNSDISHENCPESVEEIEVDVDVEETQEAEVEEVEAMSASDFRDLVAEFGAEIATEVFDANGSRELALSLQNTKLQSELDILKGKVEKLSEELADKGSDAISFQESRPAKRSLTKNLKI
jgi:hypothetical protein